MSRQINTYERISADLAPEHSSSSNPIVRETPWSSSIAASLVSNNCILSSSSVISPCQNTDSYVPYQVFFVPFYVVPPLTSTLNHSQFLRSHNIFLCLDRLPEILLQSLDYRGRVVLLMGHLGGLSCYFNQYTNLVLPRAFSCLY